MKRNDQMVNTVLCLQYTQQIMETNFEDQNVHAVMRRAAINSNKYLAFFGLGLSQDFQSPYSLSDIFSRIRKENICEVDTFIINTPCYRGWSSFCPLFSSQPYPTPVRLLYKSNTSCYQIWNISFQLQFYDLPSTTR